MKTIATALALVLMAGTTMTIASPAAAQQKPAKPGKPVQPKLSKPIMAVIIEAQKLQAAGDFAGAIARIDAAKDVPRVDADDASYMARLKLGAAQAGRNALKEPAAADTAATAAYRADMAKFELSMEESLTDSLAGGGLSPDETVNFTRVLAGLATNRKDYQKAWKAYEAYFALKPDDVDMLVRAASVNAALNAKPRVVELLTKAIDLREAAGQKGDASWYAFRAQTVIDANLADKMMPVLTSWLKAFPEPKTFNLSIELMKQRSGVLDNNMLLDFSRLMWAAGAMATSSNYLEYADAAIDRGMPNEADAALKEAIAKKLVDPAKVNIAEFVKLAATKGAESRAGVAALEREARTNPRIALVAADTLANLGQYERAVPIYRGLLGNAGTDQDTLNLRMGAALLKMGDKAGAKLAFDAVKAGPRNAIAQFYGVLVAG